MQPKGNPKETFLDVPQDLPWISYISWLILENWYPNLSFLCQRGCIGPFGGAVSNSELYNELNTALTQPD